jgi:hypothetical protein
MATMGAVPALTKHDVDRSTSAGSLEVACGAQDPPRRAAEIETHGLTLDRPGRSKPNLVRGGQQDAYRPTCFKHGDSRYSRSRSD